jgi:hypothetical protein
MQRAVGAGRRRRKGGAPRVRQAFLLGYQNHRDDPIFETRLYECRLVPCSKSKKSVALAIGKKSKRIKAERTLADG